MIKTLSFTLKYKYIGVSVFKEGKKIKTVFVSCDECDFCVTRHRKGGASEER